jgi:hypothetical protein
MIRCKICKNFYKDLHALRAHIWQRHNISTKQYYDTYLKNKDEGICSICGKEIIKFYGLKKGYSKVHRECICRDKETIEKRVNTYYINHPKKIEEYNYQCKICNSPLKDIHSLAGHLRYNHKEISVKDYYDKFIKIHKNEGICSLEDCSNETTFLGIKKGYSKHCCVRHSQLNEKVRAKIFKKRSNDGNWKKKEDKTNFELYEDEVDRLTARNYYTYFYYINPNREKERAKDKYTLDHIYSVISGFNNNIPAEIISHPCNLRLLWYSDNYKKSYNCDISINELYNKINNFSKEQLLKYTI